MTFLFGFIAGWFAGYVGHDAWNSVCAKEAMTKPFTRARTALPAALRMLERAAEIIKNGCNASQDARRWLEEWEGK